MNNLIELFSRMEGKMISRPRLFLKRIKCAIFCDKTFELINHVEQLDEGTFGMVRCPKCGLVYSILNRKDNVVR